MMQQTTDLLRQSVLQFVAAQTATRRPLFDETDVARDLGVDGEDAREFLLAFQRQFEVDLPDFAFDRHFGPEGFTLTGFVLRLLSLRHLRQPLTIGMPVEAARLRRWPHNGA
ncbi:MULTISPECIES: DUF1493 family protein [unclassified Bradyrhizobium]|uniref:DUF1493 family protein n=1 Tax=unclassified Bradyrhizobium TaxID=2631580 RepID=UPI0028E7CA32|nr:MULTISPECIES: DUF1493 family protein [unclassified Bradyrhizobium]